MINGATQIIGNVPGQCLNPLLVAESQSANHPGFVIVAYDFEPKLYDLLFLRGRAITHCARMNRDLRFFIDEQAVISTFRDHHRESLVSLFTCDDEIIDRFIATFDAEPCLKVHVDSLSKGQIVALVRSTGCSQGIIERNDFSEALPAIELRVIESSKKLPSFKSGFTHGRLLVYDCVRNQEIPFAPAAFRPSASSGHKRRCRRQTPETDLADAVEQNSSLPAPANPAAAVEALVHEILGTTVGEQSTLNDQPDTAPGPLPPRTQPASAENSTSSDRLSTINHEPSQPSEAPTEPEPPTKETQERERPQPTPFVRAIERLIRSFRQQVVDVAPQRAESIFAAAEKKARVLNAEFDVRSLDDGNAIVVLDLIEEIVKQSPLLKRSKLRETASELVSDLYNKHYDLLEEHTAVDAVEQCYYRLKGSKR